jgi:hypothetical protein
MVAVRYSSLFRSRWLALLWSAGIIWTAIEVGYSFDSSSDAVTNAADNASGDGGAADLNQVQALVHRLQNS